jgi:putative oxidoreductase
MKATSVRSQDAARPRVRFVVTWLLRIALAVLFLGAGFSKLAGEPAMVDMFAVIGAGQWLRYFVGACEIAGAIGILVPRLSALAAGGLALLMVGASIANVVPLNSSPVLTIIIFLVAALTAWLSLRWTDTPRAHHDGNLRPLL